MLTEKTGNNFICECGSSPDHYIELDYDEEWYILYDGIKSRVSENILSKDCPSLSKFPEVLDETEHLVLVKSTNGSN